MSDTVARSPIRCLCCGQIAVPRTSPMTEEQMMHGLSVLRAMGFTIAQLVSMPENVESLAVTSPGFVDWLRGLLGDPTGGRDA